MPCGEPFRSMPQNQQRRWFDHLLFVTAWLRSIEAQVIVTLNTTRNYTNDNDNNISKPPDLELVLLKLQFALFADLVFLAFRNALMMLATSTSEA